MPVIYHLIILYMVPGIGEGGCITGRKTGRLIMGGWGGVGDYNAKHVNDSFRLLLF